MEPLPFSDEQLLTYYKMGLFQFPGEDIIIFYNRIALAEERNTTVEVASFEHLFGMTPTWINIEFSNKGLAFWEGGCTWIGKQEAKVQLKESLKTRDNLYGLISKQEIVLHELVHVVRYGLSENIFEEIIAYQTSKSIIRKWFGPIFRTPSELRITLVLFCMSGLGFFIDPVISYLFFILILSFLLLRLSIYQYLFNRAKLAVNRLFNTQNPLNILLLLTDAEIISLAFNTTKQFVNSIITSPEFAYRKRLIRLFLK